jgi:hypothetical protein
MENDGNERRVDGFSSAALVIDECGDEFDENEGDLIGKSSAIDAFDGNEACFDGIEACSIR